MKPCSKNRKAIAWLALDALDARQARGLHAHLEDCEGCRQYLQEVSNITQTLTSAAIRPDVQASESFHRRMVARLRGEKSVSLWESLVAHLQGTKQNWRVALPLVAAIIVMIAAISFVQRRPGVSLTAYNGDRTVLAPVSKGDVPPTIANYQMVANRSLEKLDELLTRQGHQNPSPARIYTAADALE